MILSLRYRRNAVIIRFSLGKRGSTALGASLSETDIRVSERLGYVVLRKTSATS